MRTLLAEATLIDSRWLLVGLLAVLDAWAIGFIVASRARRREKLLWCAVVILCPIVGCTLWYVLGPMPGGRASSPRD